MPRNDLLRTFEPSPGSTGRFYSLPVLAEREFPGIPRLPIAIRVMLESALRNFDGKRVTDEHVAALAGWRATPDGPRTDSLAFVVSRVLMHDFTGVPLMVDVTGMRDAAKDRGFDPTLVRPSLPVDLIVDHSVQVDRAGSTAAYVVNKRIELARNRERFQFLKWGESAYSDVRVVPPDSGICHQINLEHLARVVVAKGDVYSFDTLIGTDSHTPMVNGLGVLGWGLGGIGAIAALLGHPLSFLAPDVVGVRLIGSLRPGVTAMDLVLAMTELLRKADVVGAFVEYFGEGASSLPLPARATLANMAPDYGATCGHFSVDEESCAYLLSTGRDPAHVRAVRAYFEAQRMFGIPRAGDIDYTRVIALDLSTIEPSVSGPDRPEERIALSTLKAKIRELMLQKDPPGFGKTEADLAARYASHVGDVPVTIGNGDVAIAAITSCTNTSNPAVVLGAGLLAKKAVERGLRVAPYVKTSLAPGSHVVTEYLDKTGLRPYLDELGFELVGYGCTTCIGNSGPLPDGIEATIAEHDLVMAAVLSGNRNFQARVHASLRANFLMSPALVVAFAIAGRVGVDFDTEPVGVGHDGPVYLRDIWPSPGEVEDALRRATDPEAYRRFYAGVATANAAWNGLPVGDKVTYDFSPSSTYLRRPPYFDPDLTGPVTADFAGARALGIFGDAMTTDDISPDNAIPPSTAAGRYLAEQGVEPADLNTYGARRGDHEVMVRGAFSNVSVKNLLVAPLEGGFTKHQPDGAQMTMYDAAQKYRSEKVPLVVIAGQRFGFGSSRDWAAKGPRLLGVRAVIAQSFERIIRSNLVAMGVLPCRLPGGVSGATLGLDGTETYDLVGPAGALTPNATATLVIRRAGGRADRVSVTVCVETAIELAYLAAGGVLPYLLQEILTAARPAAG